MKYNISANTLIKPQDIKNYSPVLLHYVGGTFGNFVYRMMHRHISGLPTIHDDFSFTNGSSHPIYDAQYADDLGPLAYKQDLKIDKTISCNLLVLKKHGLPQLNCQTFWLTKQAYYNIKLKVPNKSAYLFAMIQNILKIYDNSLIIETDYWELDWIIKNNFEKQDYLETVLGKSINALHSSWYHDVNDEKTYTFDFTDILHVDKLYNHLESIAHNLNQEMSKSKRDFYDDHAIFLKNQTFLDSYYRFINQEHDTSILLDALMKKFAQ